MNIKKILFMLCLASLSFQASSQTGSGLRGGGLAQYKNGTVNLLDLDRKFVCTWKKGSEFIESNSMLKKVIQKISEVHWYFALEFKQDLQNLNFCFTEYIYPFSLLENYRGTLNPAFMPHTYQLAFRDNQIVYVSASKFEFLDSNQEDDRLFKQAMTISHEVLHRFIGMDVPDRALKLRTFNFYIAELLNNKPSSSQQFNYNMKINSINFPYYHPKLAPYRDILTLVKSNQEDRVKLIDNIHHLESLIIPLDKKSETEFTTILKYNDWIILKNLELQKSILVDALTNSIITSNFEVFKNKIRNLNFERSEVLRNIMSRAIDLDNEKREFIFSEELIDLWLGDVINKTLNEKLIIKDYNVLINIKAAQFLNDEITLQAFGEYLPLINLPFSKTLPLEATWIAQVILKFNKRNNLDYLLNQQHLSQILNLSTLKSQVEGLNPPIKREKQYLLEKINLHAKLLQKQILDFISPQLTPSEYENIKMKLNQNLSNQGL